MFKFDQTHLGILCKDEEFNDNIDGFLKEQEINFKQSDLFNPDASYQQQTQPCDFSTLSKVDVKEITAR